MEHKAGRDWVPEVPEEQGSVLRTSILLHKKGTSFFKPLLFQGLGHLQLNLLPTFLVFIIS